MKKPFQPPFRIAVLERLSADKADLDLFICRALMLDSR
jgi:hypothetical protein